MEGTTNTRHFRRAMWIAAAASAGALAGCGGEGFANDPSPPQPIEISGVITDEALTVSPDEIGQGPIILLVSNQTESSRTVTLVGMGVKEVVGPINPSDTARLQKNLRRTGTYTVRAGAARGGGSAIRPARLTVGTGRQSSRDDLFLP